VPSDQPAEDLDGHLPWVVAVLIERVPATSRQREGTGADVVYDVQPDEDVHLAVREPGRLSLTVSRRSGRPEVAEVFSVRLTGAERVSDDATGESVTFTGFEFARGDARKVTLTLVRG
jgi:hypothetical protein